MNVLMKSVCAILAKLEEQVLDLLKWRPLLVAQERNVAQTLEDLGEVVRGHHVGLKELILFVGEVHARVKKLELSSAPP